METQESNAPNGKTITSYLVRCTIEQKEFLQKIIAESGQAAAQFLTQAASYAVEKNSGNAFLDENIAEVDILINRLSRLVKSKFHTAIEKEKQLEEMLKDNESIKLELEKRINSIQDKIELELNEKRKNLEQEYFDKEESLSSKLMLEKSEFEKREEKLLEEKKILQEKLSQKEKEYVIREKQYADSVKLHQNIEERNLELKKQNEEFKSKIVELEKFKDDSKYLEKERNDLLSKIELMKAIHEQELKNLHVEFELKSKIIMHETEKKFLVQNVEN